MTNQLRVGTQIIYVPDHADGSLSHPDCQPGFVTSVSKDGVFCRYWSKHDPSTLRTKANSELTPRRLLVIVDTRPQEEVREALREIEGGKVWEVFSYLT